MAGVELAILFSSVYVAGIIVLGSTAECHTLLGPVAPKAMLVTVVVLISLVAMGLYQFHQRLYFSEAVVRVLVGLTLACLALAVLFYAYPPILIPRDIASVAIAYALILLLLVRYVFVRTVDEHVFRRTTLVYGAGDRAASISGIRRRADRRGFKVVARVAALGDTVVGDQEVLRTDGKSIADIAIEKGAEEIVVAMDERRGNLPIRELLDARLKGIDVIDLLEFLERETGKIRIDLVSPGWLIFSPGFRRSGFSELAKRLARCSRQCIAAAGNVADHAARCIGDQDRGRTLGACFVQTGARRAGQQAVQCCQVSQHARGRGGRWQSGLGQSE